MIKMEGFPNIPGGRSYLMLQRHLGILTNSNAIRLVNLRLLALECILGVENEIRPKFGIGATAPDVETSRAEKGKLLAHIDTDRKQLTGCS